MPLTKQEHDQIFKNLVIHRINLVSAERIKRQLCENLNLIKRCKNKAGKRGEMVTKKQEAETKRLLHDVLIPSMRSNMEQAVYAMFEYDDSPFKTQHEVSHLLGISHIAHQKITEKYSDEFKSEDEKLQLIRLAFVCKAEDILEREFDNPRYNVFFEAILRTLLKKKEENSALRYQMDKGAHELLPEIFPAPQVNRDFSVVKGS